METEKTYYENGNIKEDNEINQEGKSHMANTVE